MEWQFHAFEIKYQVIIVLLLKRFSLSLRLIYIILKFLQASDLEKSEEKWRYEVMELKDQVNDLENQLKKEKTKREEETKLLARQVWFYTYICIYLAIFSISYEVQRLDSSYSVR